MNPSSLGDLKELDYPVKIEYDDEDSLFIAAFLDLPGCSAAGLTVAEAYDRAQDAKAEWLRVALEQGLPIPKPSKTRDYSGRLLLRLPVSLHATLSDRARTNGTSLNQYIVHLLSAGSAGDDIISKLEAVTQWLQMIESRTATGMSQHLRAMPSRRAESEISGRQEPQHQPLSTPSSARELATRIM